MADMTDMTPEEKLFARLNEEFHSSSVIELWPWIKEAITEAVAAERKACADAVHALRIGPAFDGAEHPSTRILNKAIAAIEGRGE